MSPALLAELEVLIGHAQSDYYGNGDDVLVRVWEEATGVAWIGPHGPGPEQREPSMVDLLVREVYGLILQRRLSGGN